MKAAISLNTISTRLLSVATILLISACGAENEFECSYFARECADDSIPVIPTACGANEPGIVDGCGEAITTLDIHDPVTLNLQGLVANTVHTITITNPDSDDIAPLPGYAAGSNAATSDKDGDIFMSTIVQNMTDAAVTGEYTVTVSDPTPTVVQTWSYTIEDRNRVQCSDSADPATAVAKASFTSGDNVYAVVKGTLSDGDYPLYVLSDSQTAIPNGGIIPGISSTITLAGGSGGLDLGNTYTSGSYDVLVDVDANGFYNRDTDLISRHARLHPCFAIQAANSGATITEQIAADRNGNKREIFDPDADKVAIRDVFANVTPSEVSALVTPATADIYVTDHQDSWADNNALTDISGTTPPEPNNTPVQNNSNSMGNLLQWSFSQLDAGCYDIVLDTNKNGVFDEGTDYVDNANHLGDNTDCGFRVSTPDDTTVTITSHADNDTTSATAIELSGTVGVPAGTLDAAFIRVTSGTQTNIVSLDSLVASNGGSFADIQLPLFSGDNYITVSGVYSDNTSRSETIRIRSVTDLALFRAQLTWDGSTDMDLHLVRPNGSYSNGGGGADDCNYSNCRVGLDGTGFNSIDWGDVIEEDDPKLDVDCVSCGNGIENIWMNEINQDGVYRVYVDAFSGNENDSDVIVSISILGSTVGQVNCGSMAAGTDTDTCYVGDITWRGGTQGAGFFRPVGTKAADF